MTYAELLQETAKKKQNAIKEINAGLKGPAGFLVEADIKKNPGKYAWSLLGREFCETLAENMSEILEGLDEWDQREIYDIYVAYEDDDPDIYYKLPYEAQLFEE